MLNFKRQPQTSEIATTIRSIEDESSDNNIDNIRDSRKKALL